MTTTPDIYTTLAAHRAAHYNPGPMGLPENASAAEYPAQMLADWKAYFDNYVSGSVDPLGSGGKLVRTGRDSAMFIKEDQKPIEIYRTMNLNWLAQQDPAIAAEWKRLYGFKPVPL